MNKQTTTLLHALGLAALLTAAPVALAVDGQKLIDMAKVAAGGLTPGDTPGFPVTITRSGSYRLSSDLVVADADTTAIDITGVAGSVTVDLNGFSILGPVTCTGSSPGDPPTTCLPVPSTQDIFGSGTGVRSFAVRSLTIRNGTIRGMGRHGIFIVGSTMARVEGVTVMGNGNFGIFGGSATVVDNIVEGNLLDGIVFNQGLVRGNTLRRNGGNGIAGTGVGGLISGNNIFGNGGHALKSISNSPYSFNNLDNNFGGFIDPPGAGVSLGGNGCNGGLCP